MKTNTSTSPKRTTSKQSSQSSQSTKVPKLAGNEDMIASVVRFPGMEQPLLVSMPSNLPSLQGVLNPPNPRCLRGRESVIQNLQHSGKEAVPLDHDLFSQYRRHTDHTSVRRAVRSARRSSRANHPMNRQQQQPPPLFQQFSRGNRSTLEQQQDAMRMKLQSNALMNWNHLVSALACTQLQKIQTTLLQQQLTIMESSSESNEIQPGEVARKVTKMKSASNLFSAGTLTNSPPHVRSMKDKQSYRYSQRSYMRMISEKYGSIRIWKHKSGRVEVKIKKITNGKGKYIDLYPEDKSGYYDFPTDVSEWYEGAWMRGPPGVGRQVYDSRQSGIVDLDNIDEKLRIDPWMYDDLVYMFVYGDVKFCNEGEKPREYISVPSLPPHMQVDDDLTLPRQTLFARPERKKRSDEGNYGMMNTGRTGDNGEISERDLSEMTTTNHDDQTKNDSGEQPPSFMKYTTQLMTLPEICMIGANEDKKPNTNENTEESKKEELVQNSFNFDDAASEESLFREIAYVVERRGDLSGSSACNSGEDASPPSLTDAPSSISPKVQSEIAMIFDDGCVKNKPEKEEEKDRESDISWSSNTMDETTTDFCSHENKIFAGSFIRRDLWTPREETKLDTPASIFNESSIWRMEDSVFEYSNDSST